MTSHISLVENDRVIGLDGHSWSPLPINGWSGFPFELHPHMRKGEVAHRYNPHALIFVRQRARGRSRIVSCGRTYELSVAPGQVDVFQPQFHMDHGWWDCTPGDLLAMELNARTLHELLQDEAHSFQLTTTLAGRDPVLERLFECMLLEVGAECRSGRLYADGITLALVAHLRASTWAHNPARSKAAKLAERQVRLVADYVETHLGADLSVCELAALVGLSPHHFARLFKAATSQTPHRFVLQRRIEASELLLRTDRSIAQIAYELGFSSQAHFTAAFRAQTGNTPARRRLY